MLVRNSGFGLAPAKRMRPVTAPDAAGAAGGAEAGGAVAAGASFFSADGSLAQAARKSSDGAEIARNMRLMGSNLLLYKVCSCLKTFQSQLPMAMASAPR